MTRMIVQWNCYRLLGDDEGVNRLVCTQPTSATRHDSGRQTTASDRTPAVSGEPGKVRQGDMFGAGIIWGR